MTGESQKARVSCLPRKLWNHISESTEIGGNLLKICFWHFLYYLLPASLEAHAFRSWHWSINTVPPGSRSRVWRLQVAMACSKIVEWAKFPLAIFQLHSSAILKFTKFLVYKKALINTPSNYICILMGDFGR